MWLSWGPSKPAQASVLLGPWPERWSPALSPCFLAQAHTRHGGLPGLASEPPWAAPEADPALSARALCQGPGCPRAQTNVCTAGPCVSSVSLLLIVYLLHFPCGQFPPDHSCW